MLKGLKIKPKIEDKILADDPILNFQDIDLKPQKKWKKQENIDVQNQETQEEKILRLKREKMELETSLIDQYDKLWESFLQGNVRESVLNCQKILQDQDKYFKKVFKEPSISNQQTHKKNFNLFEDLEPDLDDPKYQYKVSSSDQQLKNIEKKHSHNYDDMTKQFFTKYNKILNTDDQYDLMNENDEKMTDKQKKIKSKIEQKQAEKQEKHHQQQIKKSERIMSSCRLCLANKNLRSEQIISLGPSTLLMIPNLKRYKDLYHFYITTNDHYSSITQVEDDVYAEIRNFKRCLVNALSEQDLIVVFFEASTNIKRQDHMFIECIAIPQQYEEDLPKYFKNMLTDIEGNWSIHKSIIEVRKDIRQQIPKNFSYFHVDFNMKFGYAHVVEKESSFDQFQHHEIMASILELDKFEILRPEAYTYEEFKQIKNKFDKIFQQHDWTQF